MLLCPCVGCIRDALPDHIARHTLATGNKNTVSFKNEPFHHASLLKKQRGSLDKSTSEQSQIVLEQWALQLRQKHGICRQTSSQPNQIVELEHQRHEDVDHKRQL